MKTYNLTPGHKARPKLLTPLKAGRYLLERIGVEPAYKGHYDTDDLDRVIALLSPPEGSEPTEGSSNRPTEDRVAKTDVGTPTKVVGAHPPGEGRNPDLLTRNGVR